MDKPPSLKPDDLEEVKFLPHVSHIEEIVQPHTNRKHHEHLPIRYARLYLTYATVSPDREHV